jgi:hypothetical protein
MPPNAVHICLTYRCTDVCKHCFVFGSPSQTATFTGARLDRLLEQVAEVDSIRWVYFEGGEPFLYLPLLMEGVHQATRLGLATAVVTNGYWLTSERDLTLYLRPLVAAGLKKLQLSVDELHRYRRLEQLREAFLAGCRSVRLTGQVIGVELPEANSEPTEARDGELITQGTIAFRGRAATTLADDQALWSWASFDRCPHERLSAPMRMHVDPHGFVHVCQGILMGSTEGRSFVSVLQEYTPDKHPIVGPLIRGGPAALVNEYGLAHDDGYADACHLCFSARLQLRERFPEVLGPAPIYGSLEKKKSRSLPDPSPPVPLPDPSPPAKAPPHDP